MSNAKELSKLMEVCRDVLLGNVFRGAPKMAAAIKGIKPVVAKLQAVSGKDAEVARMQAIEKKMKQATSIQFCHN